jgi:hypothetical protein
MSLQRLSLPLRIIISLLVLSTQESLNKWLNGEDQSLTFLVASVRAEDHDKENGTKMLNHSDGSIYQGAPVVLRRGTLCKGMKTSNSSGAR